MRAEKGSRIERMPQTLLLSVSDVRRLIRKVGLRPFLHQLANRIEADFLRWPEFQKCARLANHSPDGVIELMPTSDGSFFTFKYVNGHPKNHAIGLPTVMGFGGMAEVSTGWPLLICEMTILTGIRTASTSAMAARALANSGSHTMALIGNGAQSEFQVLAFLEILGIRQFELFDIEPAATRRLMANLADVPELTLTPKASAKEAVRGADIVTTSTANKRRVAVLTDDMVEPGMHINAIGGDCPGKTEIAASVVANCKVFVEYEPQTRIEGEIQQLPPSFHVTELWEVLNTDLGRTSPTDVTLFDSVGFSIEDFTTLCLVHELALQHGMGTPIELIPDLPDVRNLYGSLVSE